MALKIVPADDERCDIHNRRQPPTHICERCLKELEVESALPVTTHRTPRRARARRAFRRWRSLIDRKLLIGVGAGAVILVIVLVAGGGGSGGGGSGSSTPTEADVVNALDLVPDLSRGGWITLDGACAVVSIQFGKDVQSAIEGVVKAVNENGTVGALVLQNDFSISQAECVDRISAALKTHF